MAIVPLTHVGPWTEEDLADLPEDGQRYELVEGALVVSPPPSGAHQLVSRNLTGLLAAASPPHLEVVEGLGVRMESHSVLIPDVMVAERQAVLDATGGIVPAGVVALAVEIVSPGSRTMDRVTKSALYAAAGLVSYWRVETERELTIHVHRLEGDVYVEVARSQPGQVLVVDEPFPFRLEPGSINP